MPREGGFTSVLNPDSLTTVTAKVEPALAEAEPGFSCQFERIGYFVADSIDHQPGSETRLQPHRRPQGFLGQTGGPLKHAVR